MLRKRLEEKRYCETCGKSRDESSFKATFQDGNDRKIYFCDMKCYGNYDFTRLFNGRLPYKK